MIYINTQSITEVPVGTWMAPKEKARAIAFPLSFPVADNTFYVLDLLQAFETGNFTTMQTVYFDNSANTSPVSVMVEQTQQLVTCPPLSQGYFSLQAPMPCRLQVSTAGTGLVTLNLINVQVPGAVWSTSSSSNTVSDPILEAAVTSATPAAHAVSAFQVAGIFNTTPPTLTNGQSDTLQLTSSGALLVESTDQANTTNPIGPTTAAPEMVQIGGVFNTALPTLTNGQSSALQVTSNGILIASVHTDAVVVSAAAGASAAFAAQTAGVYLTATPALTNGQSIATVLTVSGEQTVSDATTHSSLSVLASTFSNVSAPIAGAAAKSNAFQVAGVFNSTFPTLTTGQSTAIQLDSSGRQISVQYGRGHTDTVHPTFTSFTSKSVQQSVAIGGSGTVNILTPTAGVYVQSLTVAWSALAVSAQATSISLQDNGVTIWQGFVVSTPTAGVNYLTVLENYLTANSNKALTLVYAGGALTSGAIAVNITYAETAIIGP